MLFLWEIEANRTTFARSAQHMDMAFILGAIKEIYDFFRLFTILVILKMLESWQISIIYYVDKKWASPKILGFLSNLG